MFVSDSTLNFTGTKVQLISNEGFLWEVAFDPSATVDSVKKLAIEYFYPEETSATPDQFRVVHPAESRTLSDHHALHEEKLKDNDVLLFIRRRGAATSAKVTPTTPAAQGTDADLRPPTAADILEATRNLPVPVHPETPISLHPPGHEPQMHHPSFLHDDSDFHDSAVDFQLELRKIIISLVSVMATLQAGNEDANLVCQEMHTRIKTRLRVAAAKPLEGTQFTYPPPPEIPCTPQGIIQGLMELKKREFRPNPKALESLREMGFQDEEIINALRATKNSKDAAASWIVAGKGKEPLEIDDLQGLDPTGHLFDALVKAPTIRLGLNNPKTLLAFLNILESPANANAWLNDVDTSPVLSAIFKIYHSEKHAAP